MIRRRKLEANPRGIGMTSEGTRNRLVRRLREKGIRNEKVLNAISAVPRHEFVDEALSSRAYEDSALPIGSGQTISQPWIVARMTESLLENGIPDKVLEVGTGSGYQAAILSMLVPTVFTVERFEKLLKIARRRFHSLGMNNIISRHADGKLGWPSQAPFDGILVTAAASEVPEELVDQLALGGTLILPLERGGMQRLLAITRTKDGLEEKDLGGVIFVPLVSGLR